MIFDGTYQGRPVRGYLTPGRVVTVPQEIADVFRRAVDGNVPVSIAGVVSGWAAVTDDPVGYATVATLLDDGSARFDPPLPVEELPEDAIS